MLTNNANNYLSKNAQRALKYLGFATLLATSNSSHALTAGDVMSEMSSDQRFSYIAGVVGGLAYARFLTERPDETGMQCIQDWLYGDSKEKNLRRTYEWLEKHPEKPVEPLLYVLIRKECGD